MVEGTVGSGKTSLIEKITSLCKCKPFYELSDRMIEDMLVRFYHDRKRWAFTLQILFLTSRFEQIKEASRIERAILDRSIFGDVVFAKMLHRYGDMGGHELSVYERLYRSLIDSINPPYLMVYVRISTDLAVKRIKQRGRDYELIVEREYWENLNREYEKYFSSYNRSPLVIINADKYDWVRNEEDGFYLANKVKNLIERSISGELSENFRIEI